MKTKKTLNGTKTQKNLLEAFAGESMARNKYSYYASVAKKEGYVQISQIFEETAGNEKEHAKLWFKALNNGSVPTTTINLKDAATGEKFEHSVMYKKMAKEAKEEGFIEIARLFEGVGKIEASHEKRYLDLLNNIKTKAVFSKTTSQQWKCINCGNRLSAKSAPSLCPVCNHPKAYYKVEKRDY